MSVNGRTVYIKGFIVFYELYTDSNMRVCFFFCFFLIPELQRIKWNMYLCNTSVTSRM